MKKYSLLLFVFFSFGFGFSQTFTVNNINYFVYGTDVMVIETPNYNGYCEIPSTVTYEGVPYSVTTIGDFAFSSSNNLTSVSLPNSVTYIGSNAFAYCINLTSISIGNSVVSIGDSAFRNCTGLTTLALPNSINSIQPLAFFGSGLTSITIPNSVTYIGSNAFAYCTGLTTLTLSNSITSILEFTFLNCINLTSVTIPNSVTSIGIFAFKDCGLTTLTLPNSLNSIGDFAFDNCTGLTSVICDLVNPLVITSSVFRFVNQSQCSLTVPPQSYSLYVNAPVWQDFNPINGILNTEDFTLNDDLKLYPNPTKGDLFITLGNFSTSHELTIIDIQGKIIHTQKPDGLTTTINTSSFEKGVYFLNVIDGTQKTTKKFIVE
jgi:hypothetical protein